VKLKGANKGGRRLKRCAKITFEITMREGKMFLEGKMLEKLLFL
jgi:hypothetical protein